MQFESFRTVGSDVPPVAPGHAGTSSGPVVLAKPVPDVTPSNWNGPAPLAVNCQPNDYWIISSRDCEFSPAPETNCCLKYYHRPANGEPFPVDAATLHAALDPNVPVCFVIHGSYNRWGDVLSESRNITRWIRAAAPQMPLQVVCFTWPSDGNMPFLFPIDIAILGRKSSSHALFLAQVIAQLPPTQPVSLVGHSHGTRVAAATLHLLAGGSLEDGRRLMNGPAATRRTRAVLIAAAVDHDWLNPGDRYGNALIQAERVLVVKNSSDITLGLYPTRKVISDRSLGHKGLGTDDRMTMNGLHNKIVELDASTFVGTGHAWAHYYNRPELGAAIVPYVYFQGE